MDRDKMITDNLGLAQKVAKRYVGVEGRYTYDEYLSASYEGLIKAVDKYDKNKGIKFSTFATKCCLSEVYKFYTRDTWYNTKSGKKLEKQHSSLNTIIDDGENKGMELIDAIKDDSGVDYDKHWVNDFIEKIATESFSKSFVDRNIKIIKLSVLFGLKHSDIANICNTTIQQTRRVLGKFRENAKQDKLMLNY